MRRRHDIIWMLMMALVILLPSIGLAITVSFFIDCGRFAHGQGEVLNWLFGLGNGC